MEVRVAWLISVLLIQGSDQQGAAKVKPPVKNDVKGNSAIENIQKQINNIVAEMNLLKENLALQTVCLRGKKVHGKCFLADSVKKKYHPASEHCIAQGGTLVTPLSGFQNQQLADYVQETMGPDARIWLGVNDMQKEGVWVDPTGASVRFTNWEASARSSQPDGGISENCAVLSSTSGGKWLDENCRMDRASVCEFKIV